MDRSKITFAQAEGAAPLPKQLELKQLDNKIRALIWADIHKHLKATGNSYGYLYGAWEAILMDFWIEHLEKLAHEFPTDIIKWERTLSVYLTSSDYIVTLGALEFILRHPECPRELIAWINETLIKGRAAYRLEMLNGIPTITPMGSEAEAQAIGQAIVEISSHGPNNASRHLALSVEHLRSGDFGGAVRESIHAVECAACKVADDEKASLGKALSALKKKDANLHKSLEQGLNKIYGYTSDEKGIRHALAFDGNDEADVDEADALFMFGACASFVSYLLRKGREAGLIND